MKLIIQIPCFNEEQTLPLVINSIPKKIEGIDIIETLIIDDGSTDKTIEVAKKLGVNHIVRHKHNEGLAASFSDGLDEALKQGADIIVNTDGDNQYPQEDIGRLISPIVKGTHDIVVGDRQVQTISHFSPLKKLLQKIGSFTVRVLSGVSVADAPSGFRAYSRYAALSMNIVSTFSYTMETIIQAGKKKIAITHVPIRTNPKTRESRLFKSMFAHVRKSMITIIRIYVLYSPLKVFVIMGLLAVALGMIPLIRIAYLMIRFQELIGGHIQSLLLGSIFIVVGVLIILLGIISDMMAANRKLVEDVLFRIKEAALKK